MFRSWGIARKIGYSLTLFLVPVVYLLWSLIGAGQVVIDTARAEIVGEFFLRPIRDVQAAALQTMLTHQGQPMLMDALQKLRVVEQQHEDTYVPDVLLQELESALHALVLAPDDPASQEAATSAIDRLTIQVRDSSGLILDPQIDSFYLMDASAVALPSLMNQMARLGILLARPDSGIDQIAIARALAQSELAHLGSAFASASAVGVAGRTGPMERLQAETDRVAESLMRFLERMATPAGQMERSELPGLIRSLGDLGGMLGDELLVRLEDRKAGAEWDRACMLAATLALFCLAGLGIGMLLLTTVVRPVGAVTNAISLLAAGQAAVEIPHREQKDEVGALARAADIFKERYKIEKQRAQRIADLVQAFEQSASQLADKVSGSSDRLGEAAKVLHGGAGEVLLQVKAAEAAIRTATGNMAEMANAGGQLAVSIGAISDVADNTTASTEHAVTIVDASVAETTRLAEAVRTIGGIVQVIEDIASQTSLLALNATIESARAGEAGRGFAVVANEVKTLAGQTARATADISAQIQSVQEAAKASIEAVRSIGKTVQNIDTAAASIVGRVEQQRQVTKVITDNVESASGGVQTASASISSVHETVAKVESIAGEVLAEAEDLTRQAGRLRTEVDRFGIELQAA